MGNILQGDNVQKLRNNIKQKVKIITDALITNVERGEMNEKGWKAVAIVGIWISTATMFIVTKDINPEIVGMIGTASVLIALFF